LIPWLVAAAVIGLSACGDVRATPGTGPAPVQALRLLSAPLAVAPSPQFSATGRYPQFAGTSPGIAAVNRAVLEAIKADELAAYPESTTTAPATPGQHPGLYGISFEPASVTGSTEVVSFLLTVHYQAPQGNSSSTYWVGITLRTESAAPVSLASLFENPQEGWTHLAKAAQATMASKYPSCRELIMEQTTYDDVFAPTVANYKGFALTTAGVELGLNNAGNVLCGLPLITVPWKDIEPWLGAQGRALKSGIRSAPSTGS
jgi:hypothetical protein